MARATTVIEPKAYTVAEMAEAYRVSQKVVYTAIKDGELAVRYVGKGQRSMRIPEAEAAAWFDALPSEKTAQ